jgi:hypothetical protein
MAALTVQHLSSTGTAPTTTAPSASDTADYGNGKNTFLVYRNTGSTPLVLTITPAGNLKYGPARPAVTVTVPITTGEKWIPLFSEMDDGNGTSTVTITATGVAAGQTVALVRADWA